MKILSARNKKKLSIELHPCATEAYQFFHAQRFLFHKTELGSHVLDELQKGQFFSVVQASSSLCYLFSGFEIHGFSIHEFDMKNHQIVIYDDLTEEQIELLAWVGVLRTLFSSIQGGSIETLRQSINKQVPKPILNSIFSKKILTQNFIAKCTPYSTAGLKKQNKKRAAPSSEPDIKPLSIFEQLTREVSNNES